MQILKQHECHIPDPLGNWTLQEEDWRLYQHLQRGKKKMFPGSYPTDPNVTVDLDATLVIEQDDPLPGPSKPSKSTKGKAPEGPHPDPQAQEREAQIAKFIADSKLAHRALCEGVLIHGINLCEELEKEKGDEAVQSVKKGMLSCPHCSSKFSSTQRLKYHVGKEHTAKELKCAKCNGVFGSPDALKRHLGEKHHLKISKKAEPKLLECRFCEEQGTSWSSYSEPRYRSHLKEHEQKIAAGGKFTCPHCQKGYSHKRSMENHVRNSCPIAKGLAADVLPVNYTCPVPGCDQTFVEERSVNRHVRNKHPEYEASSKDKGKGKKSKKMK